MSIEQTARGSGEAPKGIGGWLMVLIAYLLLYEPLRAIPVLMALSLGGGSAAVQNVLMVGAVVQSAIALFSLYTAIGLIRQRAGAAGKIVNGQDEYRS